MRLLADESCDFAIARSLRASGHDVLAVAEFQQRSVDSELIVLAYTSRRILITEDKDFGWLVFAAHLDNPGVILIRFPSTVREMLAESVCRLVEQHGSKLPGSLVVMRPGTVRISRSPDRGS